MEEPKDKETMAEETIDINDKKNFSIIIRSALDSGIKIEDIAEVAMTPVYNVKRWLKGGHYPPLLVRKTIIKKCL